MGNFLTPEIVALLAKGAGALILFVIGHYVRNARARAVADKVVSVGIPIAFHAVEEYKRVSGKKIDDKAELGLQKLAEYVGTHGIDLTDDQAARARLVFEALHAQALAAEKK